MRTVFLAGVNMFFFICTFAQHDHSDLPKPANNEIFNIIKSLAGDWKGSYKWTGRLSEGPMDAKYYLTGNGTAVIEDLLMNGKAIMTSVYHLDGTDIRLTHYCAAGNQPRLKASEISAGKEDVTIDSVSEAEIVSLPLSSTNKKLSSIGRVLLVLKTPLICCKCF